MVVSAEIFLCKQQPTGNVADMNQEREAAGENQDSKVNGWKSHIHSWKAGQEAVQVCPTLAGPGSNTLAPGISWSDTYMPRRLDGSGQVAASLGLAMEPGHVEGGGRVLGTQMTQMWQGGVLDRPGLVCLAEH